MKKNIKQIYVNLILILLFCCSFKVFAQVPVTTNGTPATSLAGGTFNFDIELKNTGAIPGYSPYVRLILEEGLNFNSANWSGNGITSNNVGTFPAAP